MDAFLGVLLVSLFGGIIAQGDFCDLNSEVHFCSPEEICREERCEAVVSCTSDTECDVAGDACITGYCQPERCSATGECASGNRCSQDTIQRCVESTEEISVEGNSMNLNKPEPAGGEFSVITWYKGSRGNPILEYTSRIRRTMFYNEYCSDGGNCTESDKGGASPFGDLTIYSLISDDTDYYYYNIVPANGPVDPGNQYEIYLDVKEPFLCGENFTTESGSISSPGFPNDEYPGFSRCTWILTAPERHRITFNLTSIDLHQCCSCDRIEIRDGSTEDDRVLIYFCDPVRGFSSVNTTGNSAYITFESDYTQSGAGFELEWSSFLEVCDPNSDEQQCPASFICKNETCQLADRCTSGTDCNVDGEACVLGFCQPDPCTATGQCASGRICSNNSDRRCVLPRYVTATEGTEVELPRLTSQPLNSITWYKGSGDNEIAFASSVGTVVYYGEYCLGADPCESSRKGSLDNTTGTLTINFAIIGDQDDYYYIAEIPGPGPRGLDFVTVLDINVLPGDGDVRIEGLEDLAEEGATIDIICRVLRIKPEAESISWSMRGTPLGGGEVTTVQNADGKTFEQQSVLSITVTGDDDGAIVICGVTHVDGSSVRAGARLRLAECDNTFAVPQCEVGQICRNRLCETAVACTSDTDCTEEGDACQADYCQPAVCSSTGQCTRMHACSRDVVGRCVYRDVNTGLENSPTVVPLPMHEDFVALLWYKGSRASLIARSEPSGVLYSNEYCSGSSPCNDSSRGELHPTSGNLTIYVTQEDDEDVYFYDIFPIGGGYNHGADYEIQLFVYVEVTVGISGLPEAVENGTTVDLSCTIPRTEPPLFPIFWEFDGSSFRGERFTFDNNDGTFRIVSVAPFTFYSEDDGKNVDCFTSKPFGEVRTTTTVRIGVVTVTPTPPPPTTTQQVGRAASLQQQYQTIFVLVMILWLSIKCVL